MIDKDVQDIWTEIYKPEEYQASKPADFFDFEFCFLPHKEFQEAEFLGACKTLRGRFDLKAEDTLFPAGGPKNTPIDGLPVFVEKTWEQIKNHKELNLPNQREMVANFRCNELKDEALEAVEGDIHALKKKCDEQLVDGFADEAKAILKQAVSSYDEFAHGYEKGVYEKIRKELV